MSPPKKIDRPAKQPAKVKDCANAKFSLDDPRHVRHVRHVRFTNSIASMICTDAIPTNVVNCKGFKNLMSKALQSAGLQHIFSFIYSKAGECHFFFSTKKNKQSALERKIDGV